MAYKRLRIGVFSCVFMAKKHKKATTLLRNRLIFCL